MRAMSIHRKISVKRLACVAIMFLSLESVIALPDRRVLPSRGLTGPLEKHYDSREAAGNLVAHENRHRSLRKKSVSQSSSNRRGMEDKQPGRKSERKRIRRKKAKSTESVTKKEHKTSTIKATKLDVVRSEQQKTPIPAPAKELKTLPDIDRFFADMFMSMPSAVSSCTPYMLSIKNCRVFI